MFRSLLRLMCKTTNSSFKYHEPTSFGCSYSSQFPQMSGNQNKFSICVEGNIGAGKSHMLEYFKREPGVEISSEPVKKWQDIHGTNILDLMYQDTRRWGLTFQTYVQLTMFQAHTQKTNNSVKLMERSIFSAKYIFVENLYKSGMMQDVEYHILTEWFDWIVKDIHVDLIVYLRTSPETALQRIKKRNRKEEQNIPLDYLKSLHELHDDWLLNGKYKIPAEVMVLDANKGIDEMVEIFQNKRKQDLMPINIFFEEDDTFIHLITFIYLLLLTRIKNSLSYLLLFCYSYQDRRDSYKSVCVWEGSPKKWGGGG